MKHARRLFFMLLCFEVAATGDSNSFATTANLE